MMRNIFLGKWWHWLLLCIATILLWFCGSKRLHVIEFNGFIIATVLATAIILFTIIRFHRKGEQVTREVLEYKVKETGGH